MPIVCQAQGLSSKEQNRYAASLEGLTFSKVWILIKETKSLSQTAWVWNPCPDAHQLRDCGQVTTPLRASALSSANGVIALPHRVAQGLNEFTPLGKQKLVWFVGSTM